MRLRLDHIVLVGTTRRVEFTPGLNLVAGPITTGKTSLLRLCRAMVGGSVEQLPPEIRHHVSAVSGRLVLRDTAYAVSRRLVTTQDAPVDIAGEGSSLRVPLQRARTGDGLTYGRWLLEKLALPQLSVPSAPTRPAESPSVPVTISDFMLYCHIRQEDLDSSVFGHQDAFKNIKRKYVFEILFGIYDSEIAVLQGRLREVDSAVRTAAHGIQSFDNVLRQTAWDSRAALQRDLDATQARLIEIEASGQRLAQEARSNPRSQELQEEIAGVDRRISHARSELVALESNVGDLNRLTSQLETQVARLTRSIAAGTLLVDFDFKVCPRCGAPVGADPTDSDHCYLCGQTPQRSFSVDALLREQDRLESQISETRELIANSEQSRAVLRTEVGRLEAERSRTATELDFLTTAFVSDRAEVMTSIAQSRGALQEHVRRLQDYLVLFDRLAALVSQRAALESEKERIFDDLERLQTRDTEVQGRLISLENTFLQLVNRIGLPEFPGDPRAAVNRETYLPIVNGRRFEELSSGGLKVLTSLAFTLAPRIPTPRQHHEKRGHERLRLGESRGPVQRSPGHWRRIPGATADNRGLQRCSRER